MSNRFFHILIISRADHRIISADYGATDFLGHDRFSTLDEHMMPEDVPALQKALESGTGEWFFVRIRLDDHGELFGMRIVSGSDPDYVRIQAVSITLLIQEGMENAKRLESSEMITGLSGDICYDYEPETDRITLLHGEKSVYGTGVWPLSEFGDRLRAQAPSDQQVRVQEFISDLRSGTGYFRIEVKSDLTGEPSEGVGTLLVGHRVPHFDGTYSVAGVIHKMHLRHEQLSYSELQLDSLTGLVGRKDVIRIAKERITSRQQEKMALAITDIDFFKNVNDTFGHKKGDEVIRNVAGIINSVIGDHGVVGRYGGDEFLLVIFTHVDEESLRNYFRTIREEIHNAYPDLWGDSPLSVSVGCACYPDDGQNYEDLFLLADYCLYRAKYKGRNRYIIYTPAKHGSLESIRARSQEGGGFRDERNTSLSDMLITMEYQLRYGEKPGLSNVIHEFTMVYDADNVALLCGKPLRMVLAAGKRTPASTSSREGLEETAQAFLDQLMKEKDFVVINRLEALPAGMTRTVQFLQEYGMYSLLGIHFRDRTGADAMLLMTSVGRNLQWNETHFKYYRIFTDILACYDIGRDAEDGSLVAIQ